MNPPEIPASDDPRDLPLDLWQALNAALDADDAFRHRAVMDVAYAIQRRAYRDAQGSDAYLPDHASAQDTARRLVATYLDDELDHDDAIREITGMESRDRLGDLIGVLVTAVGDTWGDLDEFSAYITRALAEGYDEEQP